jgi:hypothetical protein
MCPSSCTILNQNYAKDFSVYLFPAQSRFHTIKILGFHGSI